IDDLPHELLVQLVANGEQARAQQPTSPGKATLPGRLPIQANTVLDANDWNLSRSMEYCERNLLISALDRTRGNHSRAARLLGITPRSVYNKIRKHRITP
ncbi:MAG: helix-turn-helix domain-containing protein, partial [Longimicrobiales bacterium]